ncbi:MAG: hypothetical protein ACR2QA_09390 [Solirubrobacteraceae bacterium]
MSASAPSPSAKNATAVFSVRLRVRAGVAVLHQTFADDASARDGVSGKPVKLALTDPDSNAGVPGASPRFAGDLVLVSQADQQLIFAAGLPTGRPSRTRLLLTHGGASANTEVDTLNLTTGALSPLVTGLSKAKGLAWVG